MSEISERGAVRRLHDRLGFGLRPGDLDDGFDAAVGRVLDAESDPEGPPPPTLAPVADPPGPKKPDKKAGEKPDKTAKKAANRERMAQEAKLVKWWLGRMVTSTGATERLTWFWHGHFATSEQKVRSPQLMLSQNNVFRDHARGSFTDLARALVVDPALIRWLDGHDNRKGSPNENFARELFELFTLGIGHYTEPDVFEAARALTGWTVRRGSAKAKFVAARHDAEDKTIFGRSGDFDATDVVDLALAKPESARFVIGRLWFRSVSATPPPEATMDRLLEAYGTGRDIGALLAVMVAQPAFRDKASAMVKQPVEWLVGLMRALEVDPTKLDDRIWKKVLAGLRGMGQLPFRPPSVGGWPSGASWLTTSTGIPRLQIAQLVAAEADLEHLQKASARVDAVRDLLGVDGWTSRTQNALASLDNPAQLVAVAACAPEYVVSG